MISHDHKCIFVHIPKNAGQSIEHVFLAQLGLRWETRAPLLLRHNDMPEIGPPRLAHLHADEYVKYHYLSQELFDSYYKFSFVRNPWERVVSFYKFLGYSSSLDFKRFLVEKLSDELWRDMYWFVGPQSDYLLSQDNKLLVDFVGRFESLQDDFDQVAQRLGLDGCKLPHINRSEKHVPRSRLREMVSTGLQLTGLRRRVEVFRDYRDYYDTESVEIIRHLYARDAELFSYDFES